MIGINTDSDIFLSFPNVYAGHKVGILASFSTTVDLVSKLSSV